MVGKAWWQEVREYWSRVSEGREQKEMNAMHSSPYSTQEMELPKVKVGLSSPVRLFYKCPPGHAQRCVSMVILNPVR